MDEINIEDFMKLDLRIAKIINAEPVEEADKLLKENNNISSKDLDLIKIADTKEDVMDILEEFHNNYEFSPNF